MTIFSPNGRRRSALAACAGLLLAAAVGSTPAAMAAGLFDTIGCNVS